MSNDHLDQGSTGSLPAPWQWLSDQEPEPGQHCEWVLLTPWGAKQGQGTWTVIDGAGKPLRAKGFSSGKDLMCSNSSITAWRAIAEPEPPGPTVMEIVELADQIEAAGLGQVDLVRAALARWGYTTPKPVLPQPVAEALAARPLLEKVARMADRIGQHTVGEIMAISDRAAAWLTENPPGQPVAIEPRGCPTPGACSCVEPQPVQPPEGEVGCISIDEMCEILRSLEIKAAEYTDCTILYELTFEQLRAICDTRAFALLAQRRPSPETAEPERTGACRSGLNAN